VRSSLPESVAMPLLEGLGLLLLRWVLLLLREGLLEVSLNPAKVSDVLPNYTHIHSNRHGHTTHSCT